MLSGRLRSDEIHSKHSVRRFASLQVPDEVVSPAYGTLRVRTYDRRAFVIDFLSFGEPRNVMKIT